MFRKAKSRQCGCSGKWCRIAAALGAVGISSQYWLADLSANAAEFCTGLGFGLLAASAPALMLRRRKWRRRARAVQS